MGLSAAARTCARAPAQQSGHRRGDARLPGLRCGVSSRPPVVFVAYATPMSGILGEREPLPASAAAGIGLAFISVAVPAMGPNHSPCWRRRAVARRWPEPGGIPRPRTPWLRRRSACRMKRPCGQYAPAHRPRQDGPTERAAQVPSPQPAGTVRHRVRRAPPPSVPETGSSGKQVVTRPIRRPAGGQRSPRQSPNPLGSAP